MLTIWILILFYSYLFFIRRHGSIVERSLRGSFFDFIPPKKNRNWGWEEYWLLELFIIETIILTFCLIFY